MIAATQCTFNVKSLELKLGAAATKSIPEQKINGKNLKLSGVTSINWLKDKIIDNNKTKLNAALCFNE